MAFNPNIDLGTIDRSFRVVQDKAPGLQSFDNPFSQSAKFVQVSQDFSQNLKFRVTDDVVAKLNNVYDQQLKTLNDKILYYPETLRAIDDSTFANPNSYEIPRHVTRFQILDYYGANLGSIDSKSIMEGLKNVASGTGKLLGAMTDKATGMLSGDLLGNSAASIDLGNFSSNDLAPFLSTEALNAQNRINSSSSNISEILRKSADPSKIEAQRESLRKLANDFMNGPFGGSISKKLLTMDNKSSDLKMMNQAIDDFVSNSTVHLKMLPDEVKHIIYLYAVGDNLSYSYNTRWKSAEIKRATSAALNAASLAMQGKNEEAGDAAVEVVLDVLKNRFLPEDVKTLVESKITGTPANNYEFMFDNVDRRKFGMNYTFMPKSVAEVESVGKIIAAFKYYSHPSRPNLSYYYRSPSVFLLENMTWVRDKGWVENLYLPKYKLAALQNVTVRYDQNGSLVTHEEFITQLQSNDSTFKSPVKIEMSLAFEELVLITREDLAPPQNFFDANRKNGYY